MSYTEKDAELWETDPYEYIRVKFDIFEDFVSPITAAQTVLHSVCKKRKDVLPKTMDLLMNIVQNQQSTPSQKDGMKCSKNIPFEKLTWKYHPTFITKKVSLRVFSPYNIILFCRSGEGARNTPVVDT